MNTLVSTPFGKIEGFESQGVYKFYGVPFAKPPIGELRFRAPQMVEPWEGVLQAKKQAPNPMQRPDDGSGMTFDDFTEDCLYANIFVPKDVKPGTPIIIWFPGSGFVGGGVSGTADNGEPAYNCARLAREGHCVVFAVNHRLNIFGYMNFHRYSDRFDDNLGQLDLLMAMKWVQKIGESFCGDINNVTIAGLSAGACAINGMMMTPSAYPYFHKAIVQSSCVESFFTVEEEDEIVKVFLELLGIDETQVDKILDMDYDTLYKAFWTHTGRILAKYHPTCTCCPVIDGELIVGFPTTYDYEGYDKPFIMGNCKQEGWQQKIDYNWGNTPLDNEKWINRAVYHLPEPVQTRAWRHYTKLGMDGSPQSMTDIMYTIPKLRVAEKAGKKAPAFIYRNDYCTKGMDAAGYHACHGSETNYLMDSQNARTGATYAQIIEGCEEEMIEVGNRIARQWGAFAATGNPSLPGEEWKPYDEENRYTMVYGIEDKLEKDPEKDVRLLYEGVEKLSRF